MLKLFEVSGFRNFHQKFTLDFSDVRDYKFNTDCIHNDLIKMLIVYGKNAVGKSNLGLAVFDLAAHLTEYYGTGADSYLNADKKTVFAEFRYVFKFGADEVEYKYGKDGLRSLLYEQIKVNGVEVFTYDFKKQEGDFTGLKEYTTSLNFEFKGNKLSVLRYIVNNSSFDDSNPLKQLIMFVSHMLWYKYGDDNEYIGYKVVSSDYSSFIFKDNNLAEFEELLQKAGVNERLKKIKSPTGEYELYFNKSTPISFHKGASSGTKALYTFFYWIKTRYISFLFIDEFVAFYHTALSEMLVTTLKNNKFQTILTSHNTNLLTNRIMRPDCYFILTKDRLVSFAKATTRELREGHNLEKLYLSNEFSN